MDTTSPQHPLRIVVLKWDRLYGDMIRRQITDVWPFADVLVFQKGFDALGSIQDQVPDLFITGAKIEDMDGLEHLEPFIGKRLPILVVTSRPDARTLKMLKEVTYYGIYDAPSEGLENLPTALREVIRHRPYVSPTLMEHLTRPANLMHPALTEKEQVVLSVIGDGCDDREAGERLSMAPNTVMTHRKAIMRKLGLHHKGEIMRYAVIEGYVVMNPRGVFRPGFMRKLRLTASSAAREGGDSLQQASPKSGEGADPLPGPSCMGAPA